MQKLGSDNRLKIPAFLRSTRQILQHAIHREIICWADDGNGFVIKNVDKFSTEVLPRYFKHKKYTSFVRQLNMYGFHKSRQYNTENYFSHPLFQRDCRDHLTALSEIRRKPEKKKKYEESQQKIKSNCDYRVKMEEEHFSPKISSSEESNEQNNCIITIPNDIEKSPHHQDSQEQESICLSRHSLQPQNQGSQSMNYASASNQQFIDQVASSEQLHNLLELLIRQNESLRSNHLLIRNEVLSSQNHTIIRMKIDQTEESLRWRKQLQEEENRKLKNIEIFLTRETISMRELSKQSGSLSLNVISP